MGFDYMDHYGWNSVVKEKKFNTKVCPYLFQSLILLTQLKLCAFNTTSADANGFLCVHYR